MRIGSNIPSLGSAQLARTSKAISRALERLSTGSSVNSPADDPAGFASFVRLDAQARGLRAAIKNINHTSGLVQTASSVIGSQIEIVQRMRELAVQGANGILNDSERNALNQEIQTLLEEFERLSATEFAGTHLFDGTLSANVQIGSQPGDEIDVSISDLRSHRVFQKTIGTGSFTKRQTLATGVAPTSVKSVDLNRDGILDLVSSDSVGGTASIFIGTGEGTFQSRFTVALGGTASDIITTDINSDGIMDVVGTNFSDNTVSILLGNGDGTFKPRTTVTSSTNPSGVRASDINNDGHMDLVTINDSTVSLSILFGNGDGTFQTQRTLSTGIVASSLELADINGDGIEDILTTDDTDNTISIRLGNADGTFKTRTTEGTGLTPAGLKAGDLNNDGNLDLIVLDTDDSTYSVLIGDGKGDFATRSAVSGIDASSNNDGEIQLVDLNGDGNLDMISTESGADQARVFLGNGDGTFAFRKTLSTGINPIRSTIGDFDGDGVVDFVSVDLSSNQLTVFTGESIDLTATADLNVENEDLLNILDGALETLIGEQARIEALHSRLDSAASFNLVQAESIEEAKDLYSTDIAAETSELVRQQILQQAQMAARSQANLQLKMVLELLR